MRIEDRISELESDRANWKEIAARALADDDWEGLEHAASSLVEIASSVRELERFAAIPYRPLSAFDSKPNTMSLEEYEAQYLGGAEKFDPGPRLGGTLQMTGGPGTPPEPGRAS